MAILIAILLAGFQSMREDRLRRQEREEARERTQNDRKEQVLAACSLGGSVCRALLGSYDLLQERANIGNLSKAMPIYAVNIGMIAIGHIPSHQLPYTFIAKDLMNLQLEGRRYKKIAAATRRSPPVDGQTARELRRRIGSRPAQVRELLKRFEEVAAKYDGTNPLPISKTRENERENAEGT